MQGKTIRFVDHWSQHLRQPRAAPLVSHVGETVGVYSRIIGPSKLYDLSRPPVCRVVFGLRDPRLPHPGQALLSF